LRSALNEESLAAAIDEELQLASALPARVSLSSSSQAQEE
jgi:hypothetical protein